MAAEIGTNIRKVQTPDGVIHPIYDERIPAVDTTPTSGSTNVVESGGIKEAIMESAGEVIIGTQTEATGNWTGVSKLATASDMKSGYRFTYWLPYAGSGNATLTLTFQDGTTKTLNCYYNNSVRLTTHIEAGNKIDFLYLENANIKGTAYTGLWFDKGYYSNNFDRTQSNYERRYLYNAQNPLYRYKLCGYNNGKIVPLVITDQTNATIVDKTPTTLGIDTKMGLVFYYISTNITNATTVLASLYNEFPNSFCQYTFNEDVPAYKDVYLKGTIGEDGLFYLDTTTHKSWYVFAPNRPWDGEYNSVFESGSYYMFVGPTYSSANYVQLKYNNPVFFFNGKRLIPLEEAQSGEIEESTEFLYRKSPSLTQGYYSAKEIMGRTFVWNQLVDFVNWTTSSGTTRVDDHLERTLTSGTTYAGLNYIYPPSNIKNHVGKQDKLYISFSVKATSNIALYFYQFYHNTGSSERYSAINFSASSNWAKKSVIITTPNSDDYDYILSSQIRYSGAALAEDVTVYSKDYQIVNLTKMFGAGNEPATVEEFESLFPLPYYDYNPGELISFNAEGIQTVGFNLWDEEWEEGRWAYSSFVKENTTGSIRNKNAIPVIPGSTVFVHRPTKSTYVMQFDADLNYITRKWFGSNNYSFIVSAQTRYITFFVETYGSTYNHDICINLSDPAKNGTYEPYKKSTLNLSVPSMTSGGVQIFPDGMRSAGDVYDEAIVDSDGYVRKVVRRIEGVDLGTLTWSYRSNFADGAFSADYTGIKHVGVYAASNQVNSKGYVSMTSSTLDKSIMLNSGADTNNRINIKDSSLGTDAAAFKAAMYGVMLYYELATPVEYTLDNPVFVGAEYYSGGIQKVLPENTSEPTTAPFRGKLGYRDYSYAEKQDKLTFDTTPTANSANPVTSGGVYAAINDAKVWEAGSGTNSAILKGSEGTAAGNYSTVEGYKSETGGTYTSNNISISGHDGTNGSYSHAEGLATIASGPRGAHAEGAKNLASGAAAHAEGGWNKATGQFSHAEGYLTTASNESSHAEGGTTVASGIRSHAEGRETIASGQDTHAEGRGAVASGSVSHAEGAYTKATNDAAHSEGYGTIASGDAAHSEGKDSIATGNYSHAEGHSVAKGILSHSENGDKGMEVWPVGSANATTYTSTFDEEWRSVRTAVGDTVFANIIKSSEIELKSDNTALPIKITDASYSGDTLTFSTESTLSTTALSGSTEYWINMSVAYGARSHSENMGNTSYGEGSHAEGEYTVALGNYSHVEGGSTLAQNSYEHAEGNYNVSNKASDTYGNAGNTQHSIGIGTSSARKNAVEVMQNGDVYMYGLGGYDGTNPTATTSSSIQSIVSGIVTQLSDIETVLDQIIQPTS